MSVNKQLEALGQTLFGPMPLSERTHDLWLLDDEARVGALNLEIFSYKLVDETSSASRVSAFHTLLFAQVVEEYSCLFSV